MSEIIEHGDNGNTPSVQIGEDDSRVSMKVYQDVYHQITGRTEQVRKRYSENLLIEFSEIEQLHFKVMQLSDVHKVVARNELVSIFHEKERKEQFTSFDRFRLYNANASSPTISLVLKYNFSIIPAGLDRPQEYTITIRLSSRVAMIKQLDDEDAALVSGRIFSYLAGTIAEITVDYADYIIARGFLEAFDEWIRGCKSTFEPMWIKAIKSRSHLIPESFKIIAAVLVIFFTLRAVPEFFTKQVVPELMARFFIVYGGGLYLLTSLMRATGKIIESAIDGHMALSYLKLNKGDNKLIHDSSQRNQRVFFKFCLGCALTIILGAISSKIANLI